MPSDRSTDAGPLPPRAEGRWTALIAEDEPLLAASLRADLAALWPDLQLLPVQGDGRSALEAALAQRPDLCFLDIRMPALSGLDVAAALAEDWPDGPPFPLLVFVTAYDQYAVQAFDAQAVDYLVKPVQRERLAACVERLRARLAARAPQSDALNQAVDQLRALLGQAGPGATGVAAAGGRAGPGWLGGAPGAG
jgi:DNA-binding LytR/AlgR family response regulator